MFSQLPSLTLQIGLVLVESVDATLCGVLACILLFWNRIDNQEYQDLQKASPVGEVTQPDNNNNAISSDNKGRSGTARQVRV